MGDWHEYYLIASQLKNIMREACADPPPGTDSWSIEARITMLQSALDEAERRMRDKQLHLEVAKSKELLDHKTRQIKNSEEKMKSLAKNFEERQKAASEMQEERLQLYSYKNKELDAKIEMMREASRATQERVVERAKEDEERREKMLKKIKEDRERAVQEHKDKVQKRMEHSREVLKRKKEQDEEKRRKKALAFAEHEKKLEARKAHVDTYCPDVNHEHMTTPQKNGVSSASCSQDRRTTSNLASEARKKIIRNIKEKEEQHKARYEEEQAVRLYEIQQRTAARRERQSRQQSNYVAELERRLSRGEKIIETVKEKKSRAEKVREERSRRDSVASDVISRDVKEHRKRAETLEKLRHEKILEANYRRWNLRAAHVIQKLKETLKADGDVVSSDGKTENLLPPISSFLSSASPTSKAHDHRS